jgi:predicted RNase H-like HicB family nuclease/uncharacterized damage-inducible protein DinB
VIEAMTRYGLYLESGPMRKKTMVHVLALPGCVANGPTTEEAMAATPEAIRAFLRFLHRHGEAVEPETPFETEIVQHIAEANSWLGNGSPYVVFAGDLEPITDEEVEVYLRRFGWLREELAAWAECRTDEELDATPAVKGRTERAILLHVLGPTGAYLSAALGSATGFSALHGAAERREVPLAEALRKAAEMAEERVRITTPEERAAVRELPSGPRSLRKQMRRMLEHDWEHLAELSRRPDGPSL